MTSPIDHTDTSLPDPQALRLAKLFDLRTFIGALFIIFGAVVTAEGLTASRAAIAKAVGVNLSLWTGLSMLVLGVVVTLCLALASLPAQGIWRRACALSYALTPLAGGGLFVGLSALTVGLAKGEGLQVHALPALRCVLLAAAAAWSVRLAYRQLRSRATRWRLVFALLAFSLGVAAVLFAWYPFVFRVG